MVPLPTVNKAFQLVLQAEKEKEATQSKAESAVEVSALAITKASSSGTTNPNINNVFKPTFVKRETKEEIMRKYYCDHCKMNGHSRARCFRLNGFPEWWFKNQPKAKKNSSYAVAITSNNEEVRNQDNPLGSSDQKENKLINSMVEQVLQVMNSKQAN